MTPLRLSRRTLVTMALGTAWQAHAQPQQRLALKTPAGREVEVSVWRAAGTARGRVLFSHGARSAPSKYEALTGPWVAAGWDVYAPLHVDSTDHPETARFPGLASWPARIEDVRVLAQHLGPAGYVAAGHSYGALVALALGGAQAVQPPGIEGLLRDLKVSCAIAFSPPGPQPRLIDAAGYATLAVPAFIQTGDLDVPPGAAPGGWTTHLAAYEAAASGGERYALVLAGVDHYFGGLIGRLDLPGPRQAAALTAATDLSTLFLRAYGLPDAAARAHLAERLTAAGPVQLARK